MQSFARQAARLLVNTAQGSRGMATKTAEQTWASYFPQNKVESAEAVSKHVRKEMIGFILLGPLGAGFMIYDFIYGLEEHSDELIPPYPWMRMRTYPGMPWGEDALFEYHPYVAKTWPIPEGEPTTVHGGKHGHH